MPDPCDGDLAISTLPATLASPYSAMGHALNIPEISYLIRQELQGIHLKSAVLVCKIWWRLFAPYLWERVFIDADLTTKDREVLVRNGLAARSLTLSIYDPEDVKGVVAYVAERCRNVEALHLKLFSPGLVVVDTDAMKRRLREAYEDDGAGENQSVDSDKDPDREQQFGIRSECRTDLLDSLLSKLPYVSELTLSIAHEDLRPEVLWCVPTLTRLRKLTIGGGVLLTEYILHKNRHCNWDVILRTSRECKYLNSLSVSWESNNLQDANLDTHVSKVSEMFKSLEVQDSLASDQKQQPAVPKTEQFLSLRALSVFSCEMQASKMDLFYRSCPNLRGVEFKSIQASSGIMENNLRSLALSCPNLLSFKLLNASKTTSPIDYSTSLLTSLRTTIHSLTLSETAHITTTVFGNNYSERDYTSNNKIETKWIPPLSVTTLNVRDIRNTAVLIDIITSAPTGLTHLTIDGYITNMPYLYQYSIYTDLYPNESDTITEHLFKLENNPLLRLPTFSCVETLSYLDVSSLEVADIQELKALKFLKMARQHVVEAKLEMTWSNDTLDGGEDHLEDTAATATTTAEQEQELDNSNAFEEQNYEKVFVWFPTVEHLYLVDTDYCRYSARRPFLTTHQASALVRMMPRLKAMSFNRVDAKAGLEDIIEASPSVSFNFVMRQK
ncbi:hypothetical protein BGZ96_000324 [Linnemannia gamsii]|uniref:F-box domain-containing protein n=1 Tax=Linnemannia gamsii TaxID=64522 RepID=A0ABQ7JPE2_9FUNG|nr:hypothetical protein BGZ96_000324 [Linnemannia gamsii]